MPMRTEEVVRAELLAVRETRHEQGDSISEKASREIGDQAKDLMAELSDVLSDEAKACPDCGARPHGNHKQTARYKEQSNGVLVQEVPDIYVVRCLGCGPTRTIESEVASANGATKKVTTKIIYPSSKGETITEAVAAWNNGVRIQTREIAIVAVEV